MSSQSVILNWRPLPAPTLPNATNAVLSPAPFGAYHPLGSAIVPQPLAVNSSQLFLGPAPGAPPFIRFSSSHRPLVCVTTSASLLIELDQTTPLVSRQLSTRPLPPHLDSQLTAFCTTTIHHRLECLHDNQVPSGPCCQSTRRVPHTRHASLFPHTIASIRPING